MNNNNKINNNNNNFNNVIQPCFPMKWKCKNNHNNNYNNKASNGKRTILLNID